MFQRYAVARIGLMSLPLMFGACSLNTYHPTQSIERTVPVPAAEPPPLPAPPVPDDLSASSTDVAPPAPATAAPSDASILQHVAATAQRMIGIPYRYGGSNPRGFDCSGLVFYAYGEQGVPVPRTSGEQLHASHPLNVEEALPGDLVFFRMSKRAWHVGIYLGGESFVHAPSTGKAVAIESLDDEYYLRHRIQIRRLDALK